MPPARFKRIALAGLTGLGIVLVLVASSYLVRTRPILGARIGDILAERARSHDATLRVESLAPTGLTGLELRGVDASSTVRGVEVRVEDGDVAVYPSIAALLAGEVRPRAVHLSNARVDLSPSVPETDDSESSSSSPPSEEPATDPTARKKNPSPPENVQTLALEFRDIDVRLARQSGGSFGEPLHVGRLASSLERGETGLDIGDIRGFGRGPHGTNFSMRTTSNHAAANSPPRGSTNREPDEFVGDTSPSNTTRLLVEGRDPISLTPLLPHPPVDAATFSTAELCLDCAPRRLCLHGAHAAAGSLEAETPEICSDYRPDDRSLKVASAPLTLRRNGENVPYRVRDATLTRHPDDRLSLEADLESTRAGEADLRATWDARAPSFETRLRFDRFRLGDVWRVLGVDDRLRDGVVTGELRTNFDPTFALARADGWLRWHEGTVQHPFLGRDPLRIGSSHLRVTALADLDAAAFSTPSTRVAIGDSRPLQLTGYTVRSGPGWAFRLDARAEQVRAPRLRDALPDRLARPATGATLEGAFDASMTASGHTARPDDLKFDVAVDGDVRVLRGGSFADVTRLAHEGPPAIRHDHIDLSLDSWTPLETLPDHVPRVLTAAEDARFWKHAGFDWRGVRNAMAHNLEVARLERGGSTITQQLAKNLFLSPDRTLARKIREIWVTWRLESELSKERILELYLNIAEWAPGVRGLRGAARHYFGVAPDELSIPQIVLLATLLPGPHVYGPLVDRGYLPSSRVEKVEHILSNLRYLGTIDPIDYGHWYSMARRGNIGGLDLTVCGDDEHAPPNAPDCDDVGQTASDETHSDDDLAAPG